MELYQAVSVWHCLYGNGPVTSPRAKEAKWVFGILVGIVTVIIRGYALFAGGMMFAILIANTFVPLMDEGVKAYKNYKNKRHRQGGRIMKRNLLSIQ